MPPPPPVGSARQACASDGGRERQSREREAHLATPARFRPARDFGAPDVDVRHLLRAGSTTETSSWRPLPDPDSGLHRAAGIVEGGASS